MKTIRTFSAAVLAAGMILGPTAFAQQPSHPSSQTPTNLRPESAEGKTPGPVTWTPEQLMTASVHDAWVMSGRNQATFFEMVAQLAQISAQKRNITLPNTEEAGERFGEEVKKNAKADPDQLLYVVVDKAVQQIGKTGTAASK